MPSTKLAALTSSITAPARQILATLPKKLKPAPAQADHFTTFEAGEAKVRQSKRTYYLGANGRVSQRKHLVGEVVATVRAFTTDHARFLLTEEAGRVEDRCYRQPFIGKAV